MKRLDLSCLPLKLDVGEVMEVIDHEGKYHLIKCVCSKNGSSYCEGCFFATTAKNFSCTQIKCSRRERDQDVRYIELPVENEFKQDEESEMKTLKMGNLSETEAIKVGETFIYVDGGNKKHKVRVREVIGLTGEQACKMCIFRNSVCGDISCSIQERESKDDVYYKELT